MNIGRLSWFLQRYTAIYFLIFLGYIEYLFWTSNFSFDFFDSLLVHENNNDTNNDI